MARLNYSLWGNLIRTVYWSCIVSYLHPLYWQLFLFFFLPCCEGFKLTSYISTHLELSLSVCVCTRRNPRRRQPRISEDFLSFNKQLNDTVLRINEATRMVWSEETTGNYPTSLNICVIIQNYCPHPPRRVHMKKQQRALINLWKTWSFLITSLLHNVY